MKLRLGNTEDTFKHPNYLETADTMRRAYINWLIDSSQMQAILIVWDEDNNLLAAKDIGESLMQTPDQPNIEYEYWLNNVL